MRSDEALHEALIGGDPRAFEALYDRYERPLFGFICRYLSDRQAAEDVLHDAFLALLRDRASARRAHSLRAWLFQTARHLCLNRIRAKEREARALSKEQASAEEPQPERRLEAQQTAEALQAAVGRLPLELGELYQLRSSGLSYEEMAAVLAIPLGTVKSRMHQLIHRLREELRT